MSTQTPSNPTGIGSEPRFYPTQQFFVPTAYNPYTSPDIVRSNLSIQSLFSVVYRFRYLVLVITLTSIGLSALFSEKVDPLFKATAMVIVGQYIPPIQGETGRLLNYESTKETYISTQLALLKSMNIAELVMDQNPAIADYIERKEVSPDIARGDLHATKGNEIKLKTLFDVVDQSASSGNEKNVTSSTTQTSAQANGAGSEGNKAPVQLADRPAAADRASIAYDFLKDYLDMITFEQLKGTNTVTITAESHSPGMAALIANAHAQAFIALVRARLLDNARVNLSFLKTRKEEAGKKAGDTRQALVDFAEKNAIFLQLGGPNNGTNHNVTDKNGDQLYFLSSSLIGATRDRTQAEAEYRLLRDTVATVGLRADSRTRDLQSKLAEKEGEFKTLKRSITNPQNAYMMGLREEIRNLKNQINADKNSEISQIGIKYKSLEVQERMLRDEIEKARKSTVEESKTYVRYGLLEQEDQAAQDLYRALSKELEEVYVHLNSDQRHVTLIDPARPPSEGKKRRSYINLIIGCLLGPVIGIALAFFLDLLDNTIRTVDDLRQIVDAPLLGVIPRFSEDIEDVVSETVSHEGISIDSLEPQAEPPEMNADSSNEPLDGSPTSKFDMMLPAYPAGGPSDTAVGWSQDLRTSMRPELSPSAATRVTPRPSEAFGAPDPEASNGIALHQASPNGSTKKFARQTAGEGKVEHSTTIITSKSLVLVSAPNSCESEAFRGVRTTVSYGCATQAPKLLLVTSAQKSDGKTTVSCNLAISMAQVNKRTLLIDADLRLPSVHKSFNLSRMTPGLGNYLTGERDYSEVIFESPVPNLFLLLAGQPVDGPAELIGSKKMIELLELLGDEFDQIIIDSPPVSRVADALLLARIVEGVVLVVRSGKTCQPAAESAYHRLRQMDANVLGTILNDVLSIPGYRETDYYYTTEAYAPSADEAYETA